MAITNLDELREALSVPVQSAVDYILNKTETENQEKIESTVYGGYAQSWYTRTGEFKIAWKVTGESIGGLAGGTFEYDPEKLNPSSFIDGQHTSFINPKYQEHPYGSSAEELADYIYNGYQGALKHAIPKRDAFKKLDRWLSERQIKILFKKGLKSAGLKVVKEGGAVKTEF